MNFLNGVVHHAARGFLHHLLSELPTPTWLEGDLVGMWSDPIPGAAASARGSGPYWVRNSWTSPFMLEFDSVSGAAKALKSIQRNWIPCPTRLHRRTALITEALPPIRSKPVAFPAAAPTSPLGAFTLIDEHHLIGSASTTRPFPNGEFEFVEDRLGPPSRAYRKLWEALLYAKALPGPGDRCIDAGSSPGGWTWALAQLGAQVLAIDRAPLEDSVMRLPGVQWMKHDAFTLKPTDVGPVDWLCSDVICYPEALFEWVSLWLESGLARNFICTIKMQGQTFDSATTARFASIPGSRVLHLWHNRHELTWILTRE